MGIPLLKRIKNKRLNQRNSNNNKEREIINRIILSCQSFFNLISILLSVKSLLIISFLFLMWGNIEEWLTGELAVDKNLRASCHPQNKY